MICFDMDGTIADLYGVPHWLEKLKKEDSSPYKDAKPLWDMQKLNHILKGLIAKGQEIRVISWLSPNASKEYKQAIRKEKIDWLKRYNFPAQKIHIIRHGATKADCVRQLKQKAILIDDDAKVRKGWHLGETIDPTKCNLLKVLSEI